MRARQQLCEIVGRLNLKRDKLQQKAARRMFSTGVKPKRPKMTESAEIHLIPGKKLSFQGKDWTIMKIEKGRVYLKTPGIPLQSVGWLYLSQTIEAGRAIPLK